ncbi:hypothetical protein A6R68_08495 [Neotoma lepida]|uniref:Transporter n=1 Tax=Neotoma lepida TaxID=56216 RepID=A0A1A6G2C9_NEOLE|nr:hypothetical protein A6R68_08495 [Neotoma lepida]
MEQHLKVSPKAKKKEEPTSRKRSNNPTSLSWGFKTTEVRITKIPNHFQGKKTENTLILMAFSIGLGSMWRFPYLCHQNGGGEAMACATHPSAGSFLLTYLILLLLVGIPLLYIEMVIGHNIRAWKHLVLWLRGLGYSSILVGLPCPPQACVLVSLYNSALISWRLFYLGQSFDYRPPWAYCPMVENVSLIDSPGLRTVPHQYFWYHTIL